MLSSKFKHHLNGGLCAAIFLFAPLMAAANEVSEAQARQLLQQARADLIAKPGDPQASFVLGMALRALGDNARALQVFRGLLRHDPAAARPRLELARTLELTGEFDEALFHYQQVLSAPDVPETVKVTVRRVIADIRARKPSFTFDAYLVKDTNPNQSTSSSTIWMRGLQYDLSQDAQSREVTGLKMVFSGRVPLSTDSLWFGNLQAEHAEYDISAMNISALQASVGRHMPFEKHLFSLQAGPLSARYGDEKLYSGVSLTGAWLYPLSHQLTSSVVANRRSLDYASRYAGYDADANTLELGLTYVPDITSRWDVRLAGVAHDADFAINSYSGGFVSLGYRKEFKSGWRAEGRLVQRQQAYDAVDPFFGVVRDDKSRELSLSISNSQWSWWGLSPKLIWTYSEGDSTIPLHEFSRHSLMLGVSQAF